MNAVVLHGPPTSGKDTVTTALSAADPGFRLLTKLKQGSGRSTGYRFVTAAELDELRRQQRIVAETHRYGNVYAVDRRDLDELRAEGLVPVVHIGNVTDLRRLLAGAPGDWLRVLLWVPRDVCARRSRSRGDLDTGQRLRAWDETLADLRQADRQHVPGRSGLSVPSADSGPSGPPDASGIAGPSGPSGLSGLFDLVVRTDRQHSDATAEQVRAALSARPPARSTEEVWAALGTGPADRPAAL